MKYIVISMLFISTIIYECQAENFKSLYDLQRYAARHIEYPDIDNNNWFEPIYTSYFNSLKPSLWKKILRKFGFAEEPIWQPKDFEAALDKVMSLQIKGNGVIGGMEIPEQSAMRFFVWTDLHGAFHSFVRALSDLQLRKIIDDKFQILVPNTYLVINGSAACGSPYILETMSAIFALIEKNPNNVIYLRGDSQDTQIWLTCGLGNALKVRCEATENDKLFTKLNDYINALAFALYIKEKNTLNTVKIAPYNHTIKDTLEDTLGNFSQTFNPEKTLWYSSLVEAQAKQPLKLKAIVQGYSKLDTIAPLKPLGITKREYDGAIVWMIESSQTRAYRQKYRFFYDAYGLVTFYGSLQNATFSLMSRDVRMQKGFEQEACYELTTGEKFTDVCEIRL